MHTRSNRRSEGAHKPGLLDRLLRRGRRRCGRVTFVGAGPGDPSLLTMKAVAALRSADVVLFDDLVSPAVLAHARRRARRISVGKRGDRPSCRQDDINALMVRLALAGDHVVRLKSGDPTIFGRAGEEIEALKMHAIPFQIVPGITAGIALAAALDTSLTHREHAQTVRLVTGHSRHGGLPEELDWRALADPAATTIFYMAGRMAAQIATRLTAQGLPPNTPVIIGTAISRPQQRILRCSLHTLAIAIREVDASEPVVIGVGEAFFQADASTVALSRSPRRPISTRSDVILAQADR